MIRGAAYGDVEPICGIYNHYVVHTSISFEEVAVQPEEMWRRIEEYTVHFPWLVYENDASDIVGYCYAAQWRSRASYRHTAESTIYLSPESVGSGIGSELYTELITRLPALSIHSVIGGIALPNPGSVSLHRKLGFEEVALFKSVGRKFGRWIDVSYWQLEL